MNREQFAPCYIYRLRIQQQVEALCFRQQRRDWLVRHLTLVAWCAGEDR
ncbi:MAG TPA: hypothetical protein VHP83_07815 [Aggregatilineaceae bacterium]|nr:hypothetical protein [Aggregatilineaceae bacterium]